MKIAFIGFGEAARAFRRSLATADPSIGFAAYDILLEHEGPDGACAVAMRASEVAVAASPSEAIAGADWIFSAVTAEQSLAAVRSVVPHLRQGQVLFDINSVSPRRKRDSAALVPQSGAYVDMAVMAPVHPDGHHTPVLLAGPVHGELATALRRLGFAYEVVGPEPGAATAIKMVRSLFVKGLEAITVETMLAASASGCLDEIVASLSRSYPGLAVPDLARYHFERTTRHGRRRAAEMRESAATLDDLGLHGQLAGAIADVHEKMGAVGPPAMVSEALETIAAAVLRARRG